MRQNPGVAAGAVYNNRTLPTALSLTAVLPTATAEHRSFARPQDDNPSDAQGGKLFAQPQINTLIPMPTATPTATTSPTTAPCAETQGTVVENQLETGLLPAPLKFKVYLPACYNQNPPVHYPVLYMLHGMNNNDGQWIKIGIKTAADTLIAAGEAPPFLIVMPQEDNWAIDADDTNYGKAVVTALIPWIDQYYATCADRLCRAIGGLSRGSGWAIRLGLTYPDVFGGIGAHSLSPFDGDYDDLPNWLGAIPAESAPRLYLDIGNADISLEPAKLFEAQITKLNFAHEWHIFDGGHNEAYWSAHVMDYLKWYTQAWNN
jgi:enterochelin esterase-like enzyme